MKHVDLISGTNIATTGRFWGDCPLWCKYKLKYFGCGCCFKKKINTFEDNGKADDSYGDDEESEFVL